MAPVNLQTVCLRHVPEGMEDEEELKAHNLEIAAAINRSGRFYLTPSLLKGRQILRVSIGCSSTELQDVAALWEALQAAVPALV
jgi:aromatic-L-amino-acid decarboxylase